MIKKKYYTKIFFLEMLSPDLHKCKYEICKKHFVVLKRIAFKLSSIYKIKKLNKFGPFCRQQSTAVTKR
jgi:hypothetical protein